MGMEGRPQVPNPQEKIAENEQKLQKTAEMRGKIATAGDQLTQEQRESFLEQIEKAETELKAEIEELSATVEQAESLSEDAVPEKKRPLLSEKLRQASERAYEKMKKLQESGKRMDKVAFGAFLGIGAAGMALVDVGGLGFGETGTGGIVQAGMYTMMSAYAAPALWTVARSANVVRSKFNSWRSDSLHEKSWEAKRREELQKEPKKY